MELDHLPVYITYKNVKHINFTIRKDAVDVSAPFHFPENQLRRIIRSEKTKIFKKHQALIDDSKYIPLDSVILFDKTYPIVYTDSLESQFKDGNLVISKRYKDDNRAIQAIAKELIKSELKHYLEERVAYWEEKLDVVCTYLSIRAMKTRWGSCTPSTGRIRFNLYLSLLPKDLIDYVVLHELCHLIEANHQKGFYTLLAKYCPDYEKKRKLLNSYHIPKNYLV